MKKCITCEYCELICDLNEEKEYTTTDDCCNAWQTKWRFGKGKDEIIEKFLDYLIENASEAFEYQDRELLKDIIQKYLYD